MTPIGHYAVSAVAGTLVMRLTGSPVAGAIVAFGLHIPLDLIFNEFYQWGTGWSKKLFFVALMVPAACMLAFATMISATWFATLVMGMIGIMPDVFDAILVKINGDRFLHWYSRSVMMSFTSTMLTESALALLAMVAMIVFK